VAEQAISANNVQSITSLAEQLPEGFFDDPKLDAKVFDLSIYVHDHHHHFSCEILINI